MIRWMPLELASKRSLGRDVVAINDPGHVSSMLATIRDRSSSCCTLEFYDITKSGAQLRGPLRRDIEVLMKWAYHRNDILCCCPDGRSRSTAIAYLLGSRELSPWSWIQQLDPMFEAPNPLIVLYGAEVMGDPTIWDAYLDFAAQKKSLTGDTDLR